MDGVWEWILNSILQSTHKAGHTVQCLEAEEEKKLSAICSIYLFTYLPSSSSSYSSFQLDVHINIAWHGIPWAAAAAVEEAKIRDWLRRYIYISASEILPNQFRTFV